LAEYKLYGSKRPGEKVDRVLLEGTSSNPEKVMVRGGDPVELSDESVAELRARGIDLRKVSSAGESEEKAETETETASDNPDDKSGDKK